jgi:hypothetical protein
VSRSVQRVLISRKGTTKVDHVLLAVTIKGSNRVRVYQDIQAELNMLDSIVEQANSKMVRKHGLSALSIVTPNRQFNTPVYNILQNHSIRVHCSSF